MRKIKLYIAISLNGKIAKPDGSVDWLESIPKPEESDYGYAEFYHSIDTTIQGFATYEQVINWGIPFPYSGKKNYVLTRNQSLKNNTEVEFVTKNHTDFIQELKKQDGGDIWLIGGGQINTLLFNENLIDEIQLFVMPVVIPGGIELFENIPIEKKLDLAGTKNYSTGVVELIYKL